jgi:hypothetical protein
MSSRTTPGARARIGWIGAVAISLLSLAPLTASADTSPQALPFAQNWTIASLITTNDQWDGVNHSR